MHRGQIAGLLLLLLAVFPAQAQLDPAISKQLGAGYAALINFAENPDIATARYYIDNQNGEDPVLHVTRFGGEHVFRKDKRRWNPFAGVHLPFLTYGGNLDVNGDGNIDTEWNAAGAIFTSGVKISVTTNLSLNPSLALGYMRIENDAAYSGSATNVQPLADGILFNWTSDALLTGGAIKADYHCNLGENQLYVYGGVSHNLIDTFHTSRGNVEFSSYMTTLALKSEFTHPTGCKFNRYPLSLITLLGGTSFAGPHRDALIFGYFFDAGLAVEADISRHDWIIKKFRLGAKGIYGEDVVGWSAILSWNF